MRAHRRTWMVLAVAACLAGGWVFLAVNRVRERSRFTHCVNNLKLIGLGLHNYHSDCKQFPAAAVPNSRLTPDRRLGWQLPLLPYMFCPHCCGLPEYFDIDWSGPCDEGVAKRFAILPLAPLLCPTSPYRPPLGTNSAFSYVDRNHLTEPVPATYIGIAGLGPDAPSLPAGNPRDGVFGYDRHTRLDDVRDGAASTIMVAETSSLQAPWTSGGPATVRGLDTTRRPYVGLGRQFGGNHPAGALVLMVDGSVRVLTPTAAPAIVEALTTIAGGESLPTDWSRHVPPR